jgi:UDP-N-acetylmuramate--alanine ligase
MKQHFSNLSNASRLPVFSDLPARVHTATYGMGIKAQYQAVNLKLNGMGSFNFDILNKDHSLASVIMSVPGEHNVLNALGVFAALHQLGFKPSDIAVALSEFQGTSRRFEIVGEVNGITVIDDYAHHPAKIKATLAAARNRFPGRRIIAVWQPHTYSRTRVLAAEFIASFDNADLVIISDIYASREKQESYSSSELIQAITYTTAKYIPSLPEISSFLLTELKSGDVLIVLSAGDANQVCTDVLNGLQERKAFNG